MDVLFAIVSLVIGLFLLYFVMKWAIDGSETADNIREIRRILISQHLDGGSSLDDIENDEHNKFGETLDLSVDRCPGCHAKVDEMDVECKACGLRLEDSGE